MKKKTRKPEDGSERLQARKQKKQRKRGAVTAEIPDFKRKRHGDGQRGNKQQESNQQRKKDSVAGFTMLKPQKVKQNDTEQLDASTSGKKPAGFLDKMRARLSGGQFRLLNETLYTCKGEEAYRLFEKDPASFTLYHSGYQEQLSRWPVVPIEVVIRWLRSRSTKLVVADFGCGDAVLAKSIKNKVFSLDLMSTDPSVIACNMAHTPLESASIDVAVFCLSLMGTDYANFLLEANRVLKASGVLLIAEVKSRFTSGTEQFVAALESLGFVLISEDDSNKMFIMFYLQKQKRAKDLPKQHIQWPELKACIYKRR